MLRLIFALKYKKNEHNNICTILSHLAILTKNEEKGSKVSQVSCKNTSLYWRSTSSFALHCSPLTARPFPRPFTIKEPMRQPDWRAQDAKVPGRSCVMAVWCNLCAPSAPAVCLVRLEAPAGAMRDLCTARYPHLTGFSIPSFYITGSW